ncbi:MAG: hypothetical protein ACJ76J_08490 [Thermoanaerobaculia bacterium]
MSNVPEYTKKVTGWDVTTSELEVRKEEVPHLDAHRVQLEGMSRRFKELNQQYLSLAAQRLEFSEEMRKLLRKGETLADFLRTGVRQHYGVDSDVLVAFGLVPTPRRTRATQRKAAKLAAEVPVSGQPVVPETAK